jgi:ubiquinone/menaquinone biosynthesis C-methylase UbiE
VARREEGMLAEASAKGSPLACADAQSLALRSGAFDAAIAPHMLYHVPDVQMAVRELRRVVRPRGDCPSSHQRP